MSLKKLNKKQLIRIIYVLTDAVDFAHEKSRYEIYAKIKNYKSAIQKKNGSYQFVPFPTRSVITQLIKAYDTLYLSNIDSFYPFYKFLDAGCGIGNIMLLANQIGFISYGLEIDPTTTNFAMKRGIEFDRIIKQNILTYKCYNEYDVIYFYRPIIDDKKQTKFENRVKDQMKLGAILIPVLQVNKSVKNDKRFKTISVENGVYIYQKITE
jgi:SAM-dependent methyltransferase